MGTGPKETYDRDERHAPHEAFHQSVDYFAKNNGREKDKHSPKAAIIPGKGGRGAFLKGGRVSPDSLCAIRSVSLDLVDSSLGECAEQFLKGPV